MKTLKLTLVLLLLTTLFSCSLNVGNTLQIPLDTNAIVSKVRAATGAESKAITIKVAIIGDKGYVKKQTITGSSKADIKAQTLSYDKILIGEKIKIDVFIYVNDKLLYRANDEVLITNADTKVVLKFLPVDFNKQEINIDIRATYSDTGAVVYIDIDSLEDITKVVYEKDGSINPKTLLASKIATAATKISSNQWSFEVKDLGTYTIAVEDKVGRRETKQISIGKIGDFIFIEGTTITGVIGNGMTETSNPDDSLVFIERRIITIPSFIMCDHEVTQAEYTLHREYATDKKPTADKGVGDNISAYNITWYNAIVYCNKRSVAEGFTPCYSIVVDGVSTTDTEAWGDVPTSSNTTWDAVQCDFNANGYRLPTEIEWEYAARGGKDGIVCEQTYYSNDNQTKFIDQAEKKYVYNVWNNTNSGGKAQKVRTTVPNKLGLYDMSGSVREWCWDIASSSKRVARDTSFAEADKYIAYRQSMAPNSTFFRFGLRVVRTYQ